LTCCALDMRHSPFVTASNLLPSSSMGPVCIDWACLWIPLTLLHAILTIPSRLVCRSHAMSSESCRCGSGTLSLLADTRPRRSRARPRPMPLPLLPQLSRTSLQSPPLPSQPLLQHRSRALCDPSAQISWPPCLPTTMISSL
jgi:hypothetical protein